MAAQKYDSSKKRVGRAQKKKDIRKLVIAMALANLGWGYTKMRDALRTGLKIEIGRSCVPEHSGDQAPQLQQARNCSRNPPCPRLATRPGRDQP
jgi:hypothetical protein